MKSSPFGHLPRGAVLGAAAALALTGITSSRGRGRRWIVLGAGGVILAAASYALFVPGDGFYVPLQPGVGNRVNAFAALGLVAVAYAVAMLAAEAVAAIARDARRPAAVGAVLVTALAVGYVIQIERDTTDWDRAGALQSRILGQLARAVPHPPRGATFVTFGHPAYSKGIPVFAAPWDLNGAVQLLWRDGSLTGYPAVAGLRFACGPREP